MDTLFISGLKLNTRIGVYPWEHHVPQRIVLDIEMKTDARIAAKSGQLSDTIDYALLTQRIQAFIQDTHCELIESLSEQIAQFIFAEFPVKQLKLTLHKPHALPNAGSVGITIEREAP